jgi:hypothetical protein
MATLRRPLTVGASWQVWKGVSESVLPGVAATETMKKFEMRQLSRLYIQRQNFWKEAPVGYIRSVQRSPQSKGIAEPVHSVMAFPSPFEAKRGQSLSLAIVDSSATEANEARKAANAAMGIGMVVKGHNWNALEHCESEASPAPGYRPRSEPLSLSLFRGELAADEGERGGCGR